MPKECFDIDFVSVEIVDQAAKLLERLSHQRVVIPGIPHDRQLERIRERDTIGLGDDFNQVFRQEFSLVSMGHS